MSMRDRNAWLKGGHSQCNEMPASPLRRVRFVLLGAPGVGKGTQADLLARYFGACHLSTGDLFRAVRAMNGSASRAMKAALEFMKRGDLVPDETVLALVAERIGCLRCGGGFLLDGFPRTVAQAEALDVLLAGHQLQLDAAVSYELPLNKIVARLAGRRTCSACKKVCHIDQVGESEVCVNCGGKLIQREDDRPESIRVRMKAFRQAAQPLAAYYESRNLLISVPAEGAPEAVLQRTLDSLQIHS